MTKTDDSALRQKPEEHQDQAWQQRIERAKEARREGQKAREGKSGTFATRRVPSQ